MSGHGVPTALCDAVLDGFGAFFDLPLAEKRRFVVADPMANRGYSELGKEGLAYSRGEETPPDLFEAFNVGREDATGPEYDRYREFYAAEPVARSAGRAAGDLGSSTRSRCARSPTRCSGRWRSRSVLPENRGSSTGSSGRSSRRGPSTTSGRPAPPIPLPGQTRMGAHTDYGVLTVLLADDVPGLQVFRSGQWHDVEVPRGTFVCNIGDMLEHWTNDRWTSTLHRVLPPPRVGGRAGAAPFDRPLPRLPARPRRVVHPHLRRAPTIPPATSPSRRACGCGRRSSAAGARRPPDLGEARRVTAVTRSTDRGVRRRSREHGFVVLRGLYSEAELDALQSELVDLQRRLVAGELPEGCGTVILDDPDAVIDGEPFAHYVCEITPVSARARAAVMHPVVVDDGAAR